MSNSALAIAVGGRFAEKRQGPILLIEDNTQRSERTSEIHSGDARRAPVVVRLHKILGREVEVISETSYKPGFLPRHPAGRSSIAFQLLDAAGKVRCRPVVVAGAAYGSNRAFLK